MTLPENYKYEYRKVYNIHNCWDHSYQIIGRYGAVHLSIREWIPDMIEHSAGLEFHFRQPPKYMENKAPSHLECWFLKAPCWHDGTSLYATEHYLPMHLDGEEELIFMSMAKDADKKFLEDKE